MIQADKTLDIKGLMSSRAETIAGNTLSSMKPGQVLRVVTTDGAARQIVPSLCRTLGCSLLESGEEKGTLYFHIQK